MGASKLGTPENHVKHWEYSQEGFSQEQFFAFREWFNELPTAEKESFKRSWAEKGLSFPFEDPEVKLKEQFVGGSSVTNPETSPNTEIRERTAMAPRETENAHLLPRPTKAEFENRQLHLFQSFLANSDKERDRLSNAIDLWDSVPRYSVSRQEMSKIRISDRFLEKLQLEFQHRGIEYRCTVSPARVADLDGIDRDFYPSASEELVEDALRKLAIEQQAGYFDKENQRSGVVFTLYALRQEMSKQGHARSYQQIVQSLNILSHCVVDIMPEVGSGQARITSACLASLAAVSRYKLNEDPDAKWAVQFHPLVTSAINQATHRQYNYQLLMSHDTQLARWLHRHLVLKYTYADAFKPFLMRYSTIKRSSRMLNAYTRNRDGVKAVEVAFAKLVERGILSRCDRQDETGPRKKLIDTVFTVRPSTNFIRETKAANKRQQTPVWAGSGSASAHSSR